MCACVFPPLLVTLCMLTLCHTLAALIKSGPLRNFPIHLVPGYRRCRTGGGGGEGRAVFQVSMVLPSLSRGHGRAGALGRAAGKSWECVVLPCVTLSDTSAAHVTTGCSVSFIHDNVPRGHLCRTWAGCGATSRVMSMAGWEWGSVPCNSLDGFAQTHLTTSQE